MLLMPLPIHSIFKCILDNILFIYSRTVSASSAYLLTVTILLNIRQQTYVSNIDINTFILQSYLQLLPSSDKFEM